ncbi:hypothetical protein Tco_0579267 [Tanacetum coccineum]
MGFTLDNVDTTGEIDAPFDPTKELSRLVYDHKYKEAFTASMQRSDVCIVSWLCSQVFCFVHLKLSRKPTTSLWRKRRLQRLSREEGALVYKDTSTAHSASGFFNNHELRGYKLALEGTRNPLLHTSKGCVCGRYIKASKERAKTSTEVRCNDRSSDNTSRKNGLADANANLMIKLKFLTYKERPSTKVHAALVIDLLLDASLAMERPSTKVHAAPFGRSSLGYLFGNGDALLHYDAEMELMNMILLSIPNDIYNYVDAFTSAKDIWKRVEYLMRGTIQNKVDRETHFTNEFSQFVAEPGEALVSVYNCFAQLMNDLERNDTHFPIQFKKLVNVSGANKLEKSHDPLALIAHTGSSSRNTSSYYVTHPMPVVDYEDEYQQDDVHTNSEDPLASAILLLARAITQKFSTLTNNRLRTSSNTRNQAIIQGDRVNIQSRNSGKTSIVQCYNYSRKGNYARNCPKPRVRDSKYLMKQMLLAKHDEAGVILTDEQNDFLFADASRMEEIEELSANICLMARIQPADNTFDARPSYDSEFINLEKQRDKLDLDVKDYKRKNEELQKTHSILKRQMSENEDRYHDTVLDLEAKLKKNVDLILKLGNSLQGMFMLGPKPLSVYDQQLKHGLGYPNPYTLKQAISQCPKLYLASSLGNSEISLNVRDNEDTLDDASKSQQKVYKKMNDPIAVANKQNCWTIDYSQINALYKDFVPQKELSAEQKYFPSSFIPSDKNSNATPSIPASMPNQLKPIVNELQFYFEFFKTLFQRDIKEMKDVFESTESELCELEKQNDFLKDQLLEVSLKHEVELSVLLNHECVDNSLHAEIEQLKKKSIEIQEGLQARIKILEKDVQRCEKQSVDFELKLQHEKEKHKWDSSFKNKNTNPLDYSWISKMEKLEDENVSLDFTVQSLIKERDNVKLEYQKLFNSIKY